MGYLTSFKLEIIQPESKIDDFERVLPKSQVPEQRQIIEMLRSKYENAKFSLDENGNTRESYTWYNYQDDLKEFSKNFPTMIFKLNGEGEENGDIWEAYFKNGKMQLCEARITFDKYDESKLK